MTELVASSSNNAEEPADPGYWIGAEICRNCSKAEDKPTAVREIVTQAHAEPIVRGNRSTAGNPGGLAAGVFSRF
ncbi:MAG: hypothetical protein ABSG03_07330 [Bryobacteraceae bacterium]|jgi:hypothetical protein